MGGLKSRSAPKYIPRRNLNFRGGFFHARNLCSVPNFEMSQDERDEEENRCCAVVLEYPPTSAESVGPSGSVSKKAVRLDQADVCVLEEEKRLQISDLKKRRSPPHLFVLKDFLLFNGHLSFGKISLKLKESRHNPQELMILISSDDIELIRGINDGILASQGREPRERATPVATPSKWSPELKKVRPRQTPIASPVAEGNVPVRRFGFGQTISPPRPLSLRMVKSPQIKVDNDSNRSMDRSYILTTFRDPSLSHEQHTIIECIRKGDSVFFTGGAGTGKSFLLKKISSLLPTNSTAVTASTGIAACNIGGTTLHQFLGIGREDPGTAGVAQQTAARLRKKPETLDRIRKTKTLIIDEISLIDASLFELANDILNLVRDGGGSRFFGGIQLVLCGDFLQLPPVGDNVKFCFESKLWKRAIKATFNLTKIFRQSNDSEFANILNEIRMGNCSDDTARKLLSRLSRSKLSDPDSENIAPVIKLLPLNKEVADLNERELTKLTSRVEKQSFTAIDTIFDPSFSLDLVCAAKSVVSYPVGGRVILVTTLSISDKLVNGATGTIVRFSKSPSIPYVKFDALPEPIGVPAHEWVFKQGGKELARRRQIPLNLAWGISIHKSQGMTLDACEVSLDRIFEAGQAYVALSRCRSLEGLRLISNDPSKVSVRSIKKAVRANPVCVEFYASFT